MTCCAVCREPIVFEGGKWGWLGIVGDLAAFRFHGHACTVDETIWWAFPLADLVAAVRAIDAEATA